jgi:hypothetical protein
MKRILFVAVLVFVACKKDSISIKPLASLTVTNVVVNGPAIRVGSNLTQVANNNWKQLGLMAGENDLYIWPVGDSAKPFYTDPKFFADEGSVYSLFLAGQSPNVSGVVIKDDIPFHTDSTCGVRIINLVPNSTPLNISLSNSPAVNEVSDLGFQQYTDFKIYPAKASNVSYTFQIRKASDNTILFNYSLPTPRFMNVTLVIRGIIQGSITRVNNDRYF